MPSLAEEIPIEGSHMPLRPDDQTGISLAETAVYNANEAMRPINVSETWSKAAERVKWVMDAVGPVTEVCGLYFLSTIA